MKDAYIEISYSPISSEAPMILHKGARCYARSLKQTFRSSNHMYSSQTREDPYTIPAFPLTARSSSLRPQHKQRIKAKVYIVEQDEIYSEQAV
ncbi:hypothetical protein [Dictyobacter arantiisoli]|uniref:Uncharacterized protein n=1 Tax=Dictyobacter arantiisoli TaxID=2014874 RepID=A0A5A5TJ50_9CHLR|nr:hypothetical protein [Dictyobacter arantiisoli]GCF10974.1 hypothetical protein KDI_45380 [Dictyobacter arantiisoli]